MKFSGIVNVDSDAVDKPLLRCSAHDVKYLRKMRTVLLDSSSAVYRPKKSVIKLEGGFM